MTEEEREQYLRRLVQEAAREEGENDSEGHDVSDDEDEDYVPEGDGSDVEAELVLEIPSGSDIEDSSDEETLEELHAECDSARQEQEEQLSADQYFLARDGSKWRKIPAPTGRIRAHNVIREAGGYARRGTSSNPLDIFKTIISKEMVIIIMRETNRKAENEIAKHNQNNPTTPVTWTPVTEQELYAYFGVLLAAGLNHANMQHSRELWKTKRDPVYRATMSIKRFWAINRFIRFDDQRTRAERQQTDKAAAIRDIWIMLNHNLEAVYTPTKAITVDEQLFPYKGKTKFTQYMPLKPAKYGIKVWWACDSSNSYPCKGILYTGKEPGQQREINQGERILLELTSKYRSSGRTIIADNFFTTLEGVEKLRTAGMGFVGTIRRNKKCIPKEMLPERSRPALSTEFGFTDNVALISYVPKKNRAVLLLSSLHYNTEVVGNNKKPQAIIFYNKHKGGVDHMDQMLGEYTCKRQTKRWPLAFFYNMLDVAALASFIIYNIVNTPNIVKTTDQRRKFLDSLVEQLVTPQIEKGVNNPRIMGHFSVKNAIEAFFGAPLQQQRISQPSTSKTENQKRSCRICRINDRFQRKTRFSCVVCTEPVCLQHSQQYTKCHNCINNTE